MNSRADQSERLRCALAWIQEARDGASGVGARYLAWRWALFGSAAFQSRSLQQVCADYRMSPRTMRHALHTLRTTYGIGCDFRFAGTFAVEISDTQVSEEERDREFAGRLS